MDLFLIRCSRVLTDMRILESSETMRLQINKNRTYLTWFELLADNLAVFLKSAQHPPIFENSLKNLITNRT